MTLVQRLAANRYSAYAYSYPHKTAYRPLAEPMALRELWAQEKTDALFLYLHIPFCEMRCGFCNLFTLAQPEADLPRRYVAQLLKQMQVVAEQLEQPQFARFALGGGTPTYLDYDLLAQLLDGCQRYLGLDFARTPSSVEVSPETASADKLALLKQTGISRVSMGIQSFYSGETDSLIRRQNHQTVANALDNIRSAGIATLNLDLIYGIAGQTVASFLGSLEQALHWRPEEIYLYPLYVRPQTGLGLIQHRQHASHKVFSRHDEDNQHRNELYEHGRAALLAAGYQQLSMRMFKLPDSTSSAAPVYCCQQDGMIGLGCGARSYTRHLHYASAYAVGRQSTRSIIDDYCQRPADSFGYAHYGISMDEEERKRRYVIQSLLSQPGLDLASYQMLFAGADACRDIPLLVELEQAGLAERHGSLLTLNDDGLALSDGIGPALISPRVWQRMHDFELA